MNRYPLKISTNGLSGGASAAISLSGKDFNGSAITSSISIKLPNSTTLYMPDGSYSISASPAQYGSYSKALTPAPTSANVVVNGSSASANFTYNTAYYDVYITVNHIGLLGSKEWSITVSGGEFNGQYLDQTFTEVGPTAVISLPDGDYQYKIGGASLYIITGSSGHLFIDAVPATVVASVYSIILIAIIVAIIAVVAFFVVWRRGYLSRGGELS